MKKRIAILGIVVLAMMGGVFACGSGGGSASGNDAVPKNDLAAESNVAEEENSTAENKTTAENWPLDVPRQLENDFEYTEDGKKIISIIYSIDQMDESKEFEIGKMNQRVEDINNERDDVFVTFEVIDAAGDVSQQLADCETIAVRRPTVAIINPIDSTACATAFETIYNAGIYVIDTRGAETEHRDILHLGTNEDMIGMLVGEVCADYLEENPDVNFKACLLDGGAAYPEQSKRLNGIKELAEKEPDRVEILAEQFGDWTANTAMPIAEDWTQAYPEMNLLISASGEMAVGCISAFKAANILDNVVIVTVNGNASDLAMVNEGLALATIGSNQYIAKGTLIDAAVDLANWDVTDKIYDVSEEATVVVTKDNLKEFMDIQGLTEADLIY